MKRSAVHKFMPYLLAANAVLVALLLAVMLSRGPGVMPAALAQSPVASPALFSTSVTTAAASGDIEVVPAQMSGNTWGCYIVDRKNTTICAYQYIPGERMLRFQAARQFGQDLSLSNFNTSPSPAEVRELLSKEPKGQAAEKPAATGSDNAR